MLNLADVSLKKNIFRHFKPEIGLTIPASNDEKYNRNNSAGEVFILNVCLFTSDALIFSTQIHQPARSIVALIANCRRFISNQQKRRRFCTSTQIAEIIAPGT